MFASVSSFGMPSTDSTTRFSPRRFSVNEIIDGSPTFTLCEGCASPLIVIATGTVCAVGSFTCTRISTFWSMIENEGTCWISMLRSISSSPPTISACTGPIGLASSAFVGAS